MISNELWYQIELEAYVVRGTLGTGILDDATKALVLRGSAKKLVALSSQVDAMASQLETATGNEDWIACKDYVVSRRPQAVTAFFPDDKHCILDGNLSITKGHNNIEDAWKMAYAKVSGQLR